MVITSEQLRALETYKSTIKADERIARKLREVHPNISTVSESDAVITIQCTVDSALAQILGNFFQEDLDSLDFYLDISGDFVSTDNSLFRIVQEGLGLKRTRNDLQTRIKNMVRQSLENFSANEEITITKEEIKDISIKVAQKLSKLLLDRRIDSNNYNRISCSVRKVK
ncbi:MAG: hypothetical protein AAF298_02230 [Cyanobacteria bacterium P01_A01_bin.40]